MARASFTTRVKSRRFAKSAGVPDGPGLEPLGDPQLLAQVGIEQAYEWSWGLYEPEGGAAWSGKSDEFGFTIEPEFQRSRAVILHVCSSSSLDNLVLTTGQASGSMMNLTTAVGEDSCQLRFTVGRSADSLFRLTFRTPRRIAPAHFGQGDARPLGLALTSLEFWS